MMRRQYSPIHAFSALMRAPLDLRAKSGGSETLFSREISARKTLIFLVVPLGASTGVLVQVRSRPTIGISSGQSVQAQQVITVTASSGAGGGTSSGGHSGGG